MSPPFDPGDRNPLRVAVVSTFPPRQCGVAAFTAYLCHQWDHPGSRVEVRRFAIERRPAINRADRMVAHWIDQDNGDSYTAAARNISASDADVVLVQHEFGLFGVRWPTYTDYFRAFRAGLNKPLVTTLHTVLPRPAPSIFETMRGIVVGSTGLIVMTDTSRRLLTQEYQALDSIVNVVPHGSPLIARATQAEYRARVGLHGRSVMLTLGFVHPRKGIDSVLEALPDVVSRHPNVLYVIAGVTPTEWLRNHGDSYRLYLAKLVRDSGLEKYVLFVNRFLNETAIRDYLLASDAVITPYATLHQASSGVLALSMAASRATVSSGFLQAQEVLGRGRGIIIDDSLHGSLVGRLNELLDARDEREAIERRALAYARANRWALVANAVRSVLIEAVARHAGQPS